MGCQFGVPGGTYPPQKYPSAPPGDKQQQQQQQTPGSRRCFTVRILSIYKNLSLLSTIEGEVGNRKNIRSSGLIMNSLFFFVIDKKALFKMHSDADVNRSLSRDPCWTFRSQSSVFYFLESLDFDPQSFHGTIDGIKTRQYCSRANVFFFWIQSLRRKLSKKIFHKISFT